ncbi:SDR family oxidoreductase [Ramlibacter sp. WS9]|uniref:1-hydroxy-2-glutathionyl-2-methyl-3-butene dehydrogenase n=1 Tax=Ramlibacter sp. WS9 TaxID=1882741 RepID=UPI001141F0DB|nr:SDR family oxidoreductase [Ramlibacter sp. WS9]ROZ78069.1 SDR family oxidoreductase [Ramlibacter sp. WS9]
MNNILVVGADRGIANAICRQLEARGEHVIAACMGAGEGFTEGGVDTIGGIDVTSPPAVAKLAEGLRSRGVRLDWILHVAGVLGLDELGKIDYDDMRRQFEINTLGPLRVVEACFPFLGPNAKVGIVTSRVGSLGDNSSGGMYAYRVSKAGANMVALNLHHDLIKKGISVVALHPGMVATDLTKDYPGNYNYIQPEDAARGLIARMDELSPAASGQFRHANGDKLLW